MEPNLDDSNVFILAWDMYGLESCVDATDLDKKAMWDTLKDPENARNPIGSTLHYLMLRARMNPHRNYEIYSITTTPSITKEDLIQLFEDSPQGAAELIRERGNKIFSDRAKTNSIKIT